MTTRDPATDPIPGPVSEAAQHGSWCPKMCTFACPVTAATGRDDAVPWSFHRTVTDLAGGHLEASPAAASRLEACTGCLACQVPCTFDQDVPTQVRAGRAALVVHGAAPDTVVQAVAAAGEGRSPYEWWHRPPLPESDPDPTVTVVAGCRDDAELVVAAVTLLRAAGERVRATVSDGCCGGLLDDLGALDAAEERRASLPDAHGLPVVATDPHCLPSFRAAGLEATDVVTVVDDLHTEGRLRFRGAETPVTWHDPCLLARRERVIDAPRRLLSAAGYLVTDPEHTGERTACSGAGMGMDLLAPEAAEATARRRADELPPLPVLTACAGARRHLAAAGRDVGDLLAALAERLHPLES